MKKVFLSLILSCFVALGFAQQRDTIETNSGLKYVQVRPGTGEKPGPNDKVQIYFRGTRSNGVVFDSNMDGIPLKLRLGENNAIPGWEEGLRLMREGEKGYLFVPSELAYGREGVRSVDDTSMYIIPPNEDLIFEIELADIE